ncbi:hypothetical protein JD844_020149 [Phrynosoma platyrhinos]|uniref:TNF receptor-associated protein 1 n=1 Tax=Phrynosoma platyrhinos TaxID=52577 RepID=A0ABQ7TR92_PHRPL|nr:hypothetical protein JD844_020149 [Phrynosoma platyrhinos]
MRSRSRPRRRPLTSVTRRKWQWGGHGADGVAVAAGAAADSRGPPPPRRLRLRRLRLRVFIRELISNGSDALEKLRHKLLSEGKALPELEIHLETDSKEGTVTIQDTGIGMTQEELLSNLGTIARSGSKAFLDLLENQAEASSSIIGQFGVGFYSTFMVADQVEVFSQSAEPGSPGYCWHSDGSGTFEISEASGVQGGTKIVLHLKEDCREFASEERVKEIITKYSNFISFPIYLNGHRINTLQPVRVNCSVLALAAEPGSSCCFSQEPAPLVFAGLLSANLPTWVGRSLIWSSGVVEGAAAELVGRDWLATYRAPKTLQVLVVFVLMQAGGMDALWMMEPKDIGDWQHKEFYRFIAQAYDEPRYILHYKTDAPLNIRSLFYVPQMKPSMFDVSRELGSSVALYSRKVLILSKATDILPKWLRFLKGVVDSEDIPLNLSRELLQESTLIRKLQVVLQQRLIKFFVEQGKRDPEKYAKFFEDYGLFMREGIVTLAEQEVKEDIAKLLRYESSALPAGQLTSLPEYASRMPAGSRNIYYLCAPNRHLAEHSPYFEAMRKKDAEVTPRLDTHPAMVTVLEMGAARHFLRIQQLAKTSEERAQILQPTLEINAGHALIKKLNQLRTSQPDLAQLLLDQIYDNAMIAAGLSDDPRPMVNRLNELLVKALEKH